MNAEEAVPQVVLDAPHEPRYFEVSLARPHGGAVCIKRTCGAVAQLGERCVRNAEVRGSIPLSSID